MKKLLFIVAAGIMAGCQGEVKVDERKLDKLNEAGKDLQKAVRKGVDTVASKVKKVKIKIEDK